MTFLNRLVEFINILQLYYGLHFSIIMQIIH